MGLVVTQSQPSDKEAEFSMVPGSGATYSRAGRIVLRSRPGYTLTEMVIVVLMVGMLTMISLPKFSGLVERNKLSAAREEITAAIATARAAAVQKGQQITARLRFSDGKWRLDDVKVVAAP